MKPLKIAVVVANFPEVSETFIVNQIGFLKEKKHKVKILCLGEINIQVIHPTLTRYDLLNHVSIFKWRDLMPLSKLKRLLKVVSLLIKTLGTANGSKLLSSLNPLRYKSNAINCNQFYKVYYDHYFSVERYDVVHVHFAYNAQQIVTSLKHFNKKIVVTFHGYDAHNYDANFYKDLIELPNISYTTNTEFLKNKVKALGFREDIVSVLPVGLDTSFFKPEKTRHDTFNILFIGRLIPLKAPLLAITIVEKLIEKGFVQCRFNVVGQGEEYDTCQNYINTKALNKHVTLLGNKTQLEIKEIMNTSDVFLFPGIVDSHGRSEAQGLVIQEAQSMELPVVVSNVGGIKEGVIDNKTGYVVTEKEIETFVDCLISLINNPSKQRDLGKAGRLFVVGNYDNRVLGKRLLKIYNS